MNILLLGSGGREHALAANILKSSHCSQLFVAPGNAGTASLCTNVPLKVSDFEGIHTFCKENQIEMIVVGPEDPLVLGIWDYFQEHAPQIYVVGPSKNAAQLEGSKAFAKQFMNRYDIPTATYREFNGEEYEQAAEYIAHHSLPIVLKADGLAAGKGVIIAQTHDEANTALKEILLDKKFGIAGNKVVIEQFLTGVELSVFVLTNGKDYILLPEAKDYKRIGVNDTGLNTGGMGAISPVPFADESFMKKVVDKIISPTIHGLAQEELIYEGFIFFGLINVAGEPMVIEYNCRMGDPETEVVIPRLKEHLVDLFLEMKNKTLSSRKARIVNEHAATVMCVSEGYPEKYETGFTITGIHERPSSYVYHAGTQIKDGEIVTSGGRVLTITSLSSTLKEALSESKKYAEQIQYTGKYFRSDIGYEFI